MAGIEDGTMVSEALAILENASARVTLAILYRDFALAGEVEKAMAVRDRLNPGREVVDCEYEPMAWDVGDNVGLPRTRNALRKLVDENVRQAFREYISDPGIKLLCSRKHGAIISLFSVDGIETGKMGYCDIPFADVLTGTRDRVWSGDRDEPVLDLCQRIQKAFDEWKASSSAQK